MGKEQTRRTERVTTLNDLAEAFKQSDYRAYGRLVKASQISAEFTKRLINKDDAWRKSKNADYQAAEVGILDDLIRSIEEKIKKQENPFSDAMEKLQLAKENLKKAEAEYRKAQENFDNQREKIKKLEVEKKEIEKLRTLESKKLKQIKKVTLVHPTATLSSLDKCKDTIIICTKFDADRMKFTRFVDAIFDSESENLIEDTVLEEAKKELNSIEEVLSAVEYVKMLAYYWSNNKDYELLYNSKAIQLLINSLNLS